jgi:FolB domain-containing protein
MESPLDWIHLKHWSFPCVVGILHREQERSQRLDVEVSLGLSLEQAAGGDLKLSVHYGEVLDEVQFIAQRGHWLLLESMAHVLAVHLLAAALPGRRAAAQRVIVRVSKPDIFHGKAVPFVEMQRDASWLERQPRQAFELVNASYKTLHETAQSGAYHVLIPSGTEFVVPEHSSALIMSGAVAVGAEQRKRRQILSAGETCVCIESGETTLLTASRRPLSRQS